jgi:hypothetical protein
VDDNKIICAGWIGRFGNKCHSYLYGKHIEKKFNQKFYIPSLWEGSVLFNNPAPVVSDEFREHRMVYGGGSWGTNEFDKNQKTIGSYNEKYSDNVVLRDPCKEANYGKKNMAYISLVTDADYFFSKLKLSEIKEYFEFNDEVKNTDMYKYFEDNQKTYDVAHFRRTDIASRGYVGGHSMVSKKSYYDAFKKFDVNADDVVWVSDENNFGYKYHGENPSIGGKKISWLPDFLKLVFARNLFRSNSSFSVWAGWIGNQNVFSPWLHEYSPGKEIDFDFVEGNHPHWMAVKGVHTCYQFNIKNDLKGTNKMSETQSKTNKVVTVPSKSNKGRIMMIHWNGRFGNRFFSYIYGRTYAENHNMDFYLPSKWEGSHIFKDNGYKIVDDDELRLYLNQTSPTMDNLNFRCNAVSEYNKRTNSKFTFINPDYFDSFGKKDVYYDSLCVHSADAFKTYSKKKILEWCEFNDEVKNLDIYKRLEDKQGTYDIAHLRRDDISSASYNKANPQAYSVVSKQSYLNAFKKFDFDVDKIEWTTDDWSGKWGVGKPSHNYGGWHYPEGSAVIKDVIFDWLPDFLRLYFARNIFRGNSSFSWVAGFLSPCATVYSPVLHTRKVYHKDDDETLFEFVKGNHPHWFNLKGDKCDEIIIEN